MLLTWIVSFYPYNNSVEIGIIFLITIYRNENQVPKMNLHEHHTAMLSSVNT